MTKIFVLYNQHEDSFRSIIKRHLNALYPVEIHFWKDTDPNIPNFQEKNVLIILLSSYFISSDIVHKRIRRLADNPSPHIFPIMAAPNELCSMPKDGRSNKKI